MLLHHRRRILNRIGCLRIRSGLLEEVRCEDVAHIVRPVRQQALDGAAASVRVVDPLSLDRQAPRLIEGVLVV